MREDVPDRSRTSVRDLSSFAFFAYDRYWVWILKERKRRHSIPSWKDPVTTIDVPLPDRRLSAEKGSDLNKCPLSRRRKLNT